MHPYIRRSLALSASLVLVGCGGGGSSAPPVQAPAPTPTPTPAPAPSPSPTMNPNPTPVVYLKFDELVGDRDIPGTCQQVEEAGSGRLAAQLDPNAYGNRIASYLAATQTYTVYPPRGTAVSFGPGERAISPADLITYRRPSPTGGAEQIFTIRTPVMGPPAEYVRIFELDVDQPAGAPRLRAFCVGGVTTKLSDRNNIPASITYSDFTIYGRRYSAGTGTSLANFQGIFPGSAQVSLANGVVTMRIRLDTAAAQYGPFTGSANVDPANNAFRTVLTDGAGRSLVASGAIFGPAAKEIGINLGTQTGSSTSEVLVAAVVGINR